jgi:hypothetical protein
MPTHRILTSDLEEKPAMQEVIRWIVHQENVWIAHKRNDTSERHDVVYINAPGWWQLTVTMEKCEAPAVAESATHRT